ncbi:restriction endonuclease [Flavobacterium sp. WC2421]|uniref:restriction endonuclease n=1 Tax=Flavobacterium sp. WC2421 TaxID=3234138 RepID=UPI0034659305
MKLHSVTARLSKLFSESETPYLYYRAAENIFCRSFDAENLSRGDSAFDANFNSVGVGLKTFISQNQYSTEKIAEFNKLSSQLKDFKGKALALKLAEFRNDRIQLANRLYDIENSVYHIVARKSNELMLFETDYDIIDIDNINSVKETGSSLQFNDGNNFYSYNFSKSTLFRKFEIPQNVFRLPIEIIDDPYKLLMELFEENKGIDKATDLYSKGENYVILPLYGFKDKKKFVFEKSGLNQWNAGGRKRDFGEIYIPIPIIIHQLYPGFFPKRDKEFILQIPTGQKFTAKVCQENSKALMTNPNKALSDWLLRKILNLPEGELATIEILEELGFDSVIIYKDKEGNYKIDKAKSDSFESFLGDN